jgi:hypothetical protein
MKSTQLNKMLELVNDSFSPSEVNNMILQSIDNQINNYKLKNLSNWIHNHNCDQDFYLNKINQLIQRKQELQGLIKEAQTTGCNLKLTENLEITLEDYPTN